MTARTTGGRPSSGRSPGSGGAPKRPTKRPAAGRSATGTANDNPAGLTLVDGTAALDTTAEDAPEAVEAVEAVEAQDVEAVETEDVEVDVEEIKAEDVVTDDAAQVPDVAGVADVADETAPGAETDEEPAAESAEEPAAEDVVIDLTALEDAPAPSTDPAGVPPIDANVLLRAILTPPAGIANGEGITDALTGAVPTWRLDEEPIYLETIRDLGVPAVPEADGGTGEVIVGEIVTQEA